MVSVILSSMLLRPESLIYLQPEQGTTASVYQFLISGENVKVSRVLKLKNVAFIKVTPTSDQSQLVVFSSPAEPGESYEPGRPIINDKTLNHDVTVSLYDLKKGQYVLRKTFPEVGSYNGSMWSNKGENLLIEKSASSRRLAMLSPFRVLLLNTRKAELSFVVEMIDPNDYMPTFWNEDGKSMNQLFSQSGGGVIVRTIDQINHTHSEMKFFKSSFPYDTWPKSPHDRIPIIKPIDWKYLSGIYLPNGRVAVSLKDNAPNGRTYVARTSDGAILGSAAADPAAFRSNDWVVEDLSPFNKKGLTNWKTRKTLPFPTLPPG
jgi:hypothetical protein